MPPSKYKYKARCLTPCFWLKQYWTAGKMYEGWKRPPEYFEILEPKNLATNKPAEETHDDESGSGEQGSGPSGDGTDSESQ